MRGALALIAAFAMGPLAHATSADQQKRIDRLVDKALELRRDGKDKEALEELEAAAKIERQPRIEVQIALAEQALGLWAKAEEDLARGLARGEDPWIKKNKATLEAAMATIQEHLASLDVWGPPPGAQILIDGEPTGVVPLHAPLRVPASNLELVVRASGYTTVTRSLSLKPGSTTRERVVLRSLEVGREEQPRAAEPPIDSRQTPPPPVPATADASPTGRVVAVSLAVAGAVSLGFGVWEHRSWRQSQAEFNAIGACGADLPGHGNDSRCGALYDSLSSERTLAIVGYGAGTALVAAGLVTYLLSRPGASSTATGPSTATRQAAALYASPFGVGMVGSF